MDDGIQEPTLAPSAAAVARDIGRGHVAIFLHEWAELDGITPAEWRDRVVACCDQHQIRYEMQVDSVHEVTVFVNPDNAPNDEQLKRMIQSLVRFRESGT